MAEQNMTEAVMEAIQAPVVVAPVLEIVPQTVETVEIVPQTVETVGILPQPVGIVPQLQNVQAVQPVQTPTESKTRNAFSVADRKLLCELKQHNPEWSNADVAKVASKQFNRVVSRASVHKTLKDKEKWLNSTGNLSRMKERKPKWEDLDAGLLTYYREVSCAFWQKSFEPFGRQCFESFSRQDFLA